jgi:glutaredoxin
VEFRARQLLGLAVLVALFSGASQWWAGRHEAGIGEQIASLAGPGDIHMISSETCAPCTAARRWLSQHEVAFNECFVERDAQCRQAYDRLGGPGTPLFLVHGRPQLGFSPQRLQVALELGG